MNATGIILVAVAVFLGIVILWQFNKRSATMLLATSIGTKGRRQEYYFTEFGRAWGRLKAESSVRFSSFATLNSSSLYRGL
jgi:hypothetical protein